MLFRKLVRNSLYIHLSKLKRFLYNAIARTGAQVVVPYRDEMEKRHLKVMGDLGQIVPMVNSILFIYLILLF